MATKAKTSRAPVKRKASKAAGRKPAKVKSATRAPARKAKARKQAPKRANALQRLEDALLLGVADVDRLAESMGLLGAVEPKDGRKRRR